MQWRIVGWVVAAGFLCACGSPPPAADPVSAGIQPASQPTQPTSSARQTAPERGTQAAADDPLGLTLEKPIEACGARESYVAVARYQCADGSVPLGGDARAAQQARLGSVGSHMADNDSNHFMNSHIVDMYEVPCPGATVKVFVCLYHCDGDKSPFS